jgi:hypothetical protein
MQTETNKEVANTADATAQAAAAKNQMQAQRTGQNASAGVAAGEAEQQAAQRLASTQESGNTVSRLASSAKYGQDVLGAGSQITQEQQNLATQEGNMAQGNASTEEQAAQTPSFMDELGQGLIQGGVQIGEDYCPVRGSMILKLKTEVPIECLHVGDTIRGIDGDPQTIEQIISVVVPVLKVTTNRGLVLRCSRSHSFALILGGFTEAAKSVGKTILSIGGASRIVSAEPDGVAEVFNVVTDGSHTYRANGLWSVGVGQVEYSSSVADGLVEVGG